MTTPRLELIDPANGHRKFWQAENIGNLLKTEFGRIGGAVKSHVRLSPDAEKEIQTLQRAKLRKGYCATKG